MRKSVILLSCVALLSCAKTKIDTNLPVQNNLKAANSSIRLIALTGPNQVSAVVGGFTYNLTPNLKLNDLLECGTGVQVTVYRPAPVTIPDKVLDQAGNAHLQLVTFMASSGIPKAATSVQDTVLTDNAAGPTDYYIYPISQHFADPNYNILAMPRSTTPPSGAANFKIRVINMAASVDTFHLTGPLTLTYSDGTPVSAATTGVPSGVASAYTEIPYGTYRFRLFTQSGLEVPETLTPQPYVYTTSSIHSYEPGGIYTIFVNTNNLYVIGPCGCLTCVAPANNESGNGFTLIPDITPPMNISYGKLQFVNAIPGKNCTLRLEGYTIGSGIGYRQVSPYQAVPLGDYTMQLLDDQGQVMAQQNITVNANDNFTIWSYASNGSPALTISDNDLSNPNSGQQVRFMNLSQNVPYITFTHGGQLLPVLNPSNGTFFYPDINDSTSGADASQNLAIGVPATHVPFSLFEPAEGPQDAAPYFGPQFPANTYHSNAGPPPFVPGVIMVAVKPLLPADFVFSPSTYPAGNPILQYGEPGVYTAALTGMIDTAISGSPRPDTLLIVKHFN